MVFSDNDIHEKNIEDACMKASLKIFPRTFESYNLKYEFSKCLTSVSGVLFPGTVILILIKFIPRWANQNHFFHVYF